LLTHERSEAIIAGLVRDHLKAAGLDMTADGRVQRPARAPITSKELAAEKARRGPTAEGREARSRRERPARESEVRPTSEAADGDEPKSVAEVRDSDEVQDTRRKAEDAPSTELADAARESGRGEGARGESRNTRERRERSRELPAPRRGHRPVRSATFSEEGFSYEVRDVSDGDLATLQDSVPVVAASPAVSSGAVLDMAAPAPETVPPNGWDGPVDEAFINVGRDDGVRTSDLHQALTTAGVSPSDTAYVRIRQRHTFIGVRQGLLERVVAGLNGQMIAQRQVEAQPARPRQARR